ncbi:DUF268 domain-containing protein [Athalassotoga sp.]
MSIKSKIKVLLNIKIAGIPWFLHDYREFIKQMKNHKVEFSMKLYPILTDKYKESGMAKGHYFYQDLIIAQRIFENQPLKHVDVGSRIDGFVAHVASYREIEIFDIRPLQANIKNIKFIQADLMNFTNNEFYNYTYSISALHSIEHFGLGRYGDPIDFDGHLKGLNSIYKILKKGGKFYFSVPIGPQRVEFNAHRVFNLTYLLSLFKDKYSIDSFSFVDDKGELNYDVALTDNLVNNNCYCNYGCGIFEMTKL